MTVTPITLALIAIVGFVLIEFLLRRGASAKSLHTGATDRGSTAAIIAAYVLVAVALSINFPGPHVSPIWRWLAGACAIVGVFLRVSAFRALGSSYSRTLRVESKQSLVTHGIYRWVRHPGYAAAILIWSGAAAASGSLVAVVVVFFVLVAVYVYRIKAEEAMLAKSFGAVYEQYQASSWRLLPLVY